MALIKKNPFVLSAFCGGEGEFKNFVFLSGMDNAGDLFWWVLLSKKKVG